MHSESRINRRGLVKLGAVAALVSRVRAQDAGSETGRLGVVGGRAEEELYAGKISSCPPPGNPTCRFSRSTDV